MLISGAATSTTAVSTAALVMTVTPQAPTGNLRGFLVCNDTPVYPSRDPLLRLLKRGALRVLGPRKC